MGRPGLTFLARALGNPSLRAKAKKALNQIELISLTSEEVSELVAGLQGNDGQQQRISLILLSLTDFSSEALQDFDLAGVWNHVHPFLTHDDPSLRTAAARLLENSKQIAPDMLSGLCRALTDTDARVRAAMAKTLSMSDVPFEQLRSELLLLLRDDDKEVQQQAMTALGRFGKISQEARDQSSLGSQFQ